MPHVSTFLWFDNQADEAATYYTSIFKNSKILNISRRGEDSRETPGSVEMVTFQIGEQYFMALNGGPAFKFNEAISMFVSCGTQEEVDDLWESLSAGGEKGQCGWLKDKYGLSWQIVPEVLGKLMSDPDPIKTQRVMEAVLKMGKLDAAVLQRAFEEE